MNSNNLKKKPAALDVAVMATIARSGTRFPVELPSIIHAKVTTIVLRIWFTHEIRTAITDRIKWRF